MNLWPLLLGIAIGLVVISIPILFLRGFFRQFTQRFLTSKSMIDDLRKRGERVNATITDIRASNTPSSRAVYIPYSDWSIRKLVR